MNNKVTDRMIDRAVDIWCKALHNPTFDNGDDSETGMMGMFLCDRNSEACKKKINVKEAVEKFRDNLSKRLKKDRDDNEHFHPYLDVDYGPSEELSDAAEHSGIDHSMFSIKSQVYFYGDCVASCFGYGSPPTYHYPISDNKWILSKSSFHKEEEEEILTAIIDGRLKGFTIEE